MTLTQRLTRAGATFIVFGIAAAVLPQQDGAAQATTVDGPCVPPTAQYRLTANSDGTDSGATTSVASKTSITLYSFYSIGAGDKFLAAEPTTTYSFSPLDVTASSVFNSSGVSTTFTPPVPGTVTANIHAYGSTYIVTYDFTAT